MKLLDVQKTKDGLKNKEMAITTIQQTKHPEISVKVTEVSQEVIYDNFDKWHLECTRVANSLNHTTYIGIGRTYRFFKSCFNQGLTPIQAVKKYFL